MSDGESSTSSSPSTLTKKSIAGSYSSTTIVISSKNAMFVSFTVEARRASSRSYYPTGSVPGTYSGACRVACLAPTIRRNLGNLDIYVLLEKFEPPFFFDREGFLIRKESLGFGFDIEVVEAVGYENVFVGDGHA